jgi:hypothetical protein
MSKKVRVEKLVEVNIRKFEFRRIEKANLWTLKI